MQKVRRRNVTNNKTPYLETELFPTVERKTACIGSSKRCTIEINGNRYEVDKEVAGYIEDIWQMLGAVSTRITDPDLMFSLSKGTMPIQRIKIIEHADKVKLQRVKLCVMN